MRVLRLGWLPVVVVLVLFIAGLSVQRVRSFFGSDGNVVTPRIFANDPKPFNPKTVTLEIFGSGSWADINYLDLNSRPQQVDHAALPWSVTLRTTAPSAAPTILAQGDGNDLTCQITVDGVVKNARTSSGTRAFTYCFVKSA